jgi:hypothetical protein
VYAFSPIEFSRSSLLCFLTILIYGVIALCGLIEAKGDFTWSLYAETLKYACIV